MLKALRYRSWAEPVTFPWAVVISALWYLQRYTWITMPYHRAWAKAKRLQTV
jgi:hypothetical protein